MRGWYDDIRRVSNKYHKRGPFTSETSGNPYATDEPGKLLAPSQGCSQKLVLITVCEAIGFILIGLMLPAVRTARPVASMEGIVNATESSLNGG
jgi:hypothetical protein